MANPLEDEITTADEFETALASLLRAAARNGIDPRGSWVYRDTDQAAEDWEVMIYELGPDGHAAD